MDTQNKILEKSLERSPLLEDNRAAGKGINHIRQAHYRVHKNQLLDATLSSSHQSVCVNPTYVSNIALPYAHLTLNKNCFSFMILINSVPGKYCFTTQ
jgi:hypothetical protein